MPDDTDRKIPAKGDQSKQVNREIDQRDVDSSANADLADLRIDASKLFLQATEQTRMALCVVDPYLDDNPIVYVNEAFVELTGFPREETIGRNCRFLQGENTDPAAIEKIRAAMKRETVTVIDILNYRKDGSAFWNALHIGPIYDEQDKLAYFYGSQWDITELLSERAKAEQQQLVADELQHRTGNLFAIINAIIGLSARGETDVQELSAKLAARIQALGRAHTASLGLGSFASNSVSLKGMIEDVLNPYKTDRSGRIELRGAKVELHRRTITPVGLALHELATNALKYGSLGSTRGQVVVDWTLSEDTLKIDWTERGGPPVTKPSDASTPLGHGMGSRIMQGVLREVGGTIEMDFDPKGLQVTIRIPLDEGRAAPMAA